MKSLQEKYQETLDYIYSFVDFSRTHQENLKPENFDLDRMRTFMERIENPEKDFQSLHIAGSKGKGSVSAFCSHVLAEAGYQVGLYTSPHLKDFEERIQINHQPISRSDLVELMDELKPVIETIPRLTTFEITTGLGYLYFSRHNVDIAVVEVGLGGRLDSTNIITPLVSVITALYLDHTSILGETLPKIAREKAGIIKLGVPIVLAPQEESARDVVKEIADERNAPLIEVGKDYVFQPLHASLEGQSFLIGENPDTLEDEGEKIQIPLLGRYQIENAATAYAALRTLSKRGLLISMGDIRDGIAGTVWPARFEIAQRSPPVIFDAAHNPSAIAKLRETVDQFFPQKSMILVFGISEDKALKGMFAELLPRTRLLICTQATHPRAMDPDLMAKKAADYECETKVVHDVGDALEQALQDAGDDHLILVTGSIFVAASARIAWKERGLGT
ncbi:MAG: folylpolyglutamate synthase/dihydrofolate synthase family protein [Anaerolineales bacterium]